MWKFSLVVARCAVVSAVIVLAGPALAQQCGNDGSGFSSWLQGFKQRAIAGGIRPQAANALDGLTYNSRVVQLDRNQRSMRLSFEEFYARRVNNALISQGKQRMAQYAALLSSIQQRYGVPPEIIVAIWGLETGYGRDSGNMSVLSSLATLAYDCRRSEFFSNELFSALQIVDRGHMRPDQMIGAWAGEIGQTQFLASSFVKWGADGDGDGRIDLVRSVPDVLVSTANYLRAHGWQPGAGYGPGTHNYEVLRLWNRASVYVQTISIMAGRLAG